jgi:O-antigen/teichoic acid export membrane protein
MMGHSSRKKISLQKESGTKRCRIQHSSPANLLLRIVPLALILLGATLLFERPAYAYTDPGTGLLAIQAAGSALVATGWYLRRKIYALFHRAASKGKTEELANAADGEESPNP